MKNAPDEKIVGISRKLGIGMRAARAVAYRDVNPDTSSIRAAILSGKLSMKLPGVSVVTFNELCSLAELPRVGKNEKYKTQHFSELPSGEIAHQIEIRPAPKDRLMPLRDSEWAMDIFGYTKARRAPFWSWAVSAGLPMVRLGPKKVMFDEQQVRAFIARKSK